jgi:hypothetical protein
VYLRERNQAKPAATPTASVSIQASPITTAAPGALTNPLRVPASTPVILYHDPFNSDQIDGITWDGTSSGRVDSTGGAFGFIANPGATLYAGFGDHGIHDRSGQVVARYDSGNQKGFAGTWADDGRHYCQMVSASALPPAGGEPASLRLGAPGESSRTIAQVASMGDQFGAGVAACSVVRDRAVVVQGNSDGSARQFWLVQLSTGRILLDSARLGQVGRQVVATADGEYIAAGTTIYGPTGSVLGHVAGTIEALSWDGSLAVVTGSESAVSVVRWRDGTRVWTAPHGATFYDAAAEPAGQRIAVGLGNAAYQQTTGFPPLDVYVVGVDGHAILLLQKVTM